ncbi:MAG: hypothetical protein OEX81_04680 [Candidatus Pacebacteria bacterium]|nr:hypothetical protein [Candidatus Paceibacterota bacterium]
MFFRSETKSREELSESSATLLSEAKSEIQASDFIRDQIKEAFDTNELAPLLGISSINKILLEQNDHSLATLGLLETDDDLNFLLAKCKEIFDDKKNHQNYERITPTSLVLRLIPLFNRTKYKPIFTFIMAYAQKELVQIVRNDSLDPETISFYHFYKKNNEIEVTPDLEIAFKTLEPNQKDQLVTSESNKENIQLDVAPEIDLSDWILPSKVKDWFEKNGKDEIFARKIIDALKIHYKDGGVPVDKYQINWDNGIYLLIEALQVLPITEVFSTVDSLIPSEESKLIFLLSSHWLRVLLQDEATQKESLDYIKQVIQNKNYKEFIRDFGSLIVGEELFRMGETKLGGEIWPYTFLIKRIRSYQQATLLFIRMDASRLRKAEEEKEKDPPPKNKSKEVKKKFKKHLAHKKQSLKKYLTETFEQLEGVDTKVIKQLKESLFKVIDNGNVQEVQFLSLIIKKHGLFSDEVIALFKDNEQSSNFLNLEKTGSDIEIGLGQFRGILVNTVSEESLAIWQTVQNLTDNDSKSVIPVTQIIKNYPDRKNKQLRRVVTPYSGMSVGELLRIFHDEHNLSEADLYERLGLDGRLKSPSLSLGYRVVLLMEELRVKLGETKGLLAKHKIDHGHPHPFNFFVSFVDKRYLEEQRAQGNNLNSLEYSPEKVTFNVEEYLENTEQYEVVVRLGDWDQPISQ